MLYIIVFKRVYNLNSFLSINDYAIEAKKVLPRSIYSFFECGADEELTHHSNAHDFKQTHLYPRVLIDVSEIKTSTTLIGSPLSIPAVIAPMAFQCLSHEMGEIATAKAASHHDTLMTVSTCSSQAYEEISNTSKNKPWFQLYIFKDREVTRELIRMAERFKYGAILITVDAPYYGKRIDSLKNPIKLNNKNHLTNLKRAGLELDDLSLHEIPSYLTSMLDPSVTWQTIEWIQTLTKLPLILKGILRREDIERASQIGIQSAIISNHGGRQLDTCVSSFHALKYLSSYIKTIDMDIILDGGIRHGTDILKALAYGAKAVMIGRPVLWGLAVNGEKGVFEVLEILKEELKLAMAFCGACDVTKVSTDIIFTS